MNRVLGLHEKAMRVLVPVAGARSWKGQYGLESGCEIGVYTRPIGSAGTAYALLDADGRALV